MNEEETLEAIGATAKNYEVIRGTAFGNLIYNLQEIIGWTKEEGPNYGPSTYPVVICPARYSGTYESGEWLAFPTTVHQLAGQAPDWDGDDITCMTFWREQVAANPRYWPIGAGNTPTEAYQDLLSKLATLTEQQRSEKGE